MSIDKDYLAELKRDAEQHFHAKEGLSFSWCDVCVRLRLITALEEAEQGRGIALTNADLAREQVVQFSERAKKAEQERDYWVEAAEVWEVVAKKAKAEADQQRVREAAIEALAYLNRPVWWKRPFTRKDRLR